MAINSIRQVYAFIGYFPGVVRHIKKVHLPALEGLLLNLRASAHGQGYDLEKEYKPLLWFSAGRRSGEQILQYCPE